MKNERWKENREVRALSSAVLTGESAPSRVVLVPWGKVESTNGNFVVDDESVRLAVEAFEQHATDLPIDYEHQTLGGSYASPTGQAPAAGWIKRLFGEEGVGLLAEIEWTPQGKEMIGSKQYRYLSPVAIVRKSDRKLIGLHSAALTNKPAIVGMEPIVNREDEGTDGVSALTLLRTELGVAEDAEVEEVLIVAGRRVAELERESRRRRVEERVREAMRSGKLVEAQRAWAEELAARDESLFDEWFATAPVVIVPGTSVAPKAGENGQARSHAVVARARSEYRTQPLLGQLTSEEAYVKDAMKQAAKVA